VSDIEKRMLEAVKRAGQKHANETVLMLLVHENEQLRARVASLERVREAAEAFLQNEREDNVQYTTYRDGLRVLRDALAAYTPERGHVTPKKGAEEK
jgi:hypothetical protein